MPAPTAFTITPEQIIVAWGFLSPFLKKRAAASQPLWDDRVVALADMVFANQAALYWFCQVINRQVPPQAFQENAPAELKQECRAFAGNMQFVEGWLRDAGVAIELAPNVSARINDQTGLSYMAGLEAAAPVIQHYAEADRLNGAYVVHNDVPAPELGQPYVDPAAGGSPGSAPDHPAVVASGDNITTAQREGGEAAISQAAPVPAPHPDGMSLPVELQTAVDTVTAPAQPAIEAGQPSQAAAYTTAPPDAAGTVEHSVTPQQ
jgi:hypothetical protein